MKNQGRPTTRLTPLIVERRVPVVRIKNFCQENGPDIMSFLSDFDHLPGEKITLTKSLLQWMKKLRHNNVPVYCYNNKQKSILWAFHRHYRKLGAADVKKSIEATCFPRRKFYGRYESWYIHAHTTQGHPNFCQPCRERLDQHLGYNVRAIQNLRQNLPDLDLPEAYHR